MNKHYETDYVRFSLEGENKTIVVITAEDSRYREVLVARYNFEDNTYKYYYDLKGNKKEVARFSTIMNYLFKQNENLGWDKTLVDTAKENAKRIKQEEKKAYKQELKQRDESKAKEFINGIMNNEERYINICENMKEYDNEKVYDLVKNTFKHASKKVINEVYNAINEYNTTGKIETIINETMEEVAVTIDNEIQEDTPQTNQETTNQVESITYTAFNRTFNSYESAVQYCHENDFSTEYIEKVVTRQPSNNNIMNNDASNEKEMFHLYNNTFESYSQAYDHAIKNVIPITMIISSKHPSMTSERLKQLHTSFVFDKMKMSYNDMKEYYNYLEPLPETLDKQDIYYKLRSWIQRYESRQKSIEEDKQRKYELAKHSAELLEYMVNNGLEIKEKHTMVKYYYKGEHVHTWFSGISIEEYANGIQKVYDTYFSDSIAI